MEERLENVKSGIPSESKGETGKNEVTEPFDMKKYFAISLDPVHVGTGGYRLGRVDNTIVREPGTNIPKIPGSSIAGVTRAYTAMAIQANDPEKKRYLKLKDQNNNSGDPAKSENIYLSCAGKGAEDGDGHCGKSDCEVCMTFGYSKKNSSFQGLAQFHDARILFFPVYSMIGPVWITCPGILAYFNKHCQIKPEKFKPINTSKPPKGGKLNFL